MVKKLTSFDPGESETDDVVRRWLTQQGIDQNLVSGYSIFRHQGEIPRIMLEMYFDDTPPKVEDVSRETSTPPSAQQYLVTQSVPVEPTIVTVLRRDHLDGMHYGRPNVNCPLCKPPVPDWCPDVLLCFNCPGRLSGEQAKCDHWPQAEDESKEG